MFCFVWYSVLFNFLKILQCFLELTTTRKLNKTPLTITPLLLKVIHKRGKNTRVGGIPNCVNSTLAQGTKNCKLMVKRDLQTLNGQS